jgi:formylglycine-generating enzyme required for sulfatase activity
VDRWAEVPAGLYTPLPASLEQIEMMTLEPDHPTQWVTASGIAAVFVDRDHQVVWVMFDDGYQRHSANLLLVPFVPRPRAAWPSGCPSNLGSTHMEVLALTTEELPLASTTVQRPVLVRDCPPDPMELVLRDDGAIGGGGVACVGAETCVALAWASDTLTLPQSMKGYELYSWLGEKDGIWRYTLATGTNRAKTWEEITTPESVLTEDDWVKITVAGEAALKSVLARLPKGEHVMWIGPGDPRAPSISGDGLRLPSEKVLQELDAYGQQLGIHLDISEGPPKPATSISPTSLPLRDGTTMTVTRRRSKDAMVMVYVPGGTFQMGSLEPTVFGDTDPVHTVTLDAFWIDRTEVTNAQYAAFLNAEGNQWETYKRLELGAAYTLIERVDDALSADSAPSADGTPLADGVLYRPKEGYADHPVVNVTWYGAAHYCAWVGMRLPTEAEWEYAARGPDGRRYPWGDQFDPARLNYCDVNCRNRNADVYDDGYAETSPVGSFSTGVSWCGALDMAGNVWEWVTDWYDRYPSDAQVNPQCFIAEACEHEGADNTHVLRGGGHLNGAEAVRATERGWNSAFSGVFDLGFRCAAGAVIGVH